MRFYTWQSWIFLKDLYDIITENFAQSEKTDVGVQVDINDLLSSQKNLTDQNKESSLSSEELKADNLSSSKTRLYYSCKDRVNYEILRGHQYEIVENPDRDNCRNSRIYICKYDNCGKSFSKTWNLVYHFRVHTGERPFVCSDWKKTFSKKYNLKKHIEYTGCVQS